MAAEPRDVVERFLADVMSGSRPDSAPELVGSQPLRRRIEALRMAFPDLQVRTVRTVVQDSLVAVHLVATGTHHGRYQGAPPTGRSWSSTCSAIFDVRDGRIVDFWLTWDTLTIAEQLGVVRRSRGVSA